MISYKRTLEGIFKDGKYNDVEFKLGDLSNNRIIFAGLYPPGRSLTDYQHSNATSKNVIKHLGTDRFDWIDIFPFAPELKSSDIMMSNLKANLKENETFSQKWVKNIRTRIIELHNIGCRPIVFICGTVCKYHWELELKSQQWKQDKVSKFNDVHFKGEISNIVFDVVYGQHPSAPLTGRGNSKAISRFESDMELLFQLFTYGKPFLSIEERQRQLKSDELCLSLFKTSTWPQGMEHMKHTDFNNIRFVTEIMSLHKSQNLVFLTNKAFALKFQTENFVEEFQIWRTFTQNEHLEKLCQIDNFCVNLIQPKFKTNFQKIRWIFVKMSSEHNSWNFMCQLGKNLQFFSILENDSFLNAFEKLLLKYSIENVLTMFQNDRLCHFISSTSNFNVLQILEQNFTLDEVANLLKRPALIFLLEDPNFLEAFRNTQTKFETSRFVELLSSSEFCRCFLIADFLDKVYDVLHLLGNDATRVFSSNSFFRHLHSNEFVDILRKFLELVGTRYTSLLFKNAVFCNKVEDTNFMTFFLNLSQIVTPLKARRLFAIPQFCNLVTNALFDDTIKRLLADFSFEDLYNMFSNVLFCKSIMKEDFQKSIFSMLTFPKNEHFNSLIARLLSSDYCSYVGNDQLWKLFIQIKQNFTLEVAVNFFSHDRMCVLAMKENNLDKVCYIINLLKTTFKDRYTLLLKNPEIMKNCETNLFVSQWQKLICKFPLVENMRIDPGFVTLLCNTNLESKNRLVQDYCGSHEDWISLYKTEYYVKKGEEVKDFLATNFELDDWDIVKLCCSNGFCSNYQNLLSEMKTWENIIWESISKQNTGYEKVKVNDYLNLFGSPTFCTCKRPIRYQERFKKIANDTKYGIFIALSLFSVKSISTSIDEVYSQHYVQSIDRYLDIYDSLKVIFGKDTLRLFRSSEFVTRCHFTHFIDLILEIMCYIEKENILRLFESNHFPAHICPINKEKTLLINDETKKILIEFANTELMINIYTKIENYDNQKQMIIDFESKVWKK
jgi:hypothetical protein